MEEDCFCEKMMLYGVGIFLDVELFVILIGLGNMEDFVVELMCKVLSDYYNSLNELGKIIVDELCYYKGIGFVKVIIILVVFELGKC